MIEPKKEVGNDHDMLFTGHRHRTRRIYEKTYTHRSLCTGLGQHCYGDTIYTRRYVQKALRRIANARRCVQCLYEKLMKCKHEKPRPQPAATSTVNERQHTTETGKSEVGSGRTKMGCGSQKI